MLNDKHIQALKPKQSRYLEADKDGLYIAVFPTGVKSFVFGYKDPKTFKRKLKKLGRYPEFSLDMARKELIKLKFNLINHQSISEKVAVNESFFEMSERYFNQKNNVSARTIKNSRAKIQNYCKKILDYQIDKITRADIFDIFEKLKLAKKAEVADKLYTDLNNIFIYAINRDLLENNPLNNLRRKDIIYKRQVKHYATITDKDGIKKLLGDILHTNADIKTKIATLLSLFTAQRSFTIRASEWSEFDLEKGIWTINAQKMKMKGRGAHIVHLNTPCLEMLKFWQKITGGERYLFSSIRSKSEIMSDNTIRSLFRRAGYSNEDFTPHGFRSMFSTILNEHRSEHGLSKDIIELCLAHLDENAVRASYNFAQNLEDRKRLFEWWGEFLFDLEPRLLEFTLESV